MQTAIDIKKRLESAFDKAQAALLSEVITEAYSDLVKTGDFNELKEIVRELAEAQKRTDIKVGELAEAQKRTENELHELVIEHKETRKQLGGISDTVGYGLEDKSFKALPDLLKRDFNLIVRGKLKRQYIKDNKGKEIELNIIGEAVKDGREIVIVGECKSQLSKNDVNEFVRRKLKRLDVVFKEIFPVLVTYMTSEPDAEKYAEDRGIALYYSYDF
ncbi:MAG: hypothetical protein SV062_03635 [Thermodesulfobacteriota bacterium]|nr:hypothetical protein [Thermodesulfobacteriota bacterium]